MATTANQTKPEGWAWQINNAVNIQIADATPSECSRAMTKYRASMPQEYAKAFLFNAWLDTEDRNAIACIIQEQRA